LGLRESSEESILSEYDYSDYEDEPGEERPSDPRQREAQGKLRDFFEQNREQVFFSRQLEVVHENDYFHWITNRALRELRDEGFILGETRPLSTGGSINLLWHRGYRFHRRSARRMVALVEEYADPNIGGAVGLHGEFMVLEGFARCEFVMRGRNTREYAGKVWTGTGHNLDFIFEKEGQAYGIEVKNTLGYMDYEEFQTKIRLCEFLGIRPVFAARMLPRTWINELIKAGGYGLIMKYQLYPWTHKELAKRVAGELGLPVDAPRALAEGTMRRFLEWHRKKL
jgi:hypothetical protein